MKKLLLKWIIATVSIYLAGQVAPGFSVAGWKAAFGAAVIFGLLNFAVKPLLKLLALPATLLTFGLFLFVINGFMVYILGMISTGIMVDGLLSGILASVVISAVTMVLNMVFGVKDKK